MKKRANITFFSFLFLMGTIQTSCVKNEDFDLPEITFEEPQVSVNSSIASIKQMYGQYDETPLLIEGDSLILEGFVVSNDKSGNFYKELVIQDAPENPAAGIVIATEASDLYTFFEPGRKIYVILNGLYIGEDTGGVISLGELYEGQIGRMAKETFETHVLRSGEVAEIVPETITLGEVDDSKISTLVQFENMQFPTAFLGESYGNIDNTYNVDRPVINCGTGQSISMRISGFADFKNQLLPEGSGKITAVLSKFNTEYQIKIRNTEDVDFMDPRCDETSEDSGEIVELPYTQNFEGTINGEYIALPGWANINLNGGDEKYMAAAFNTNQYAEISAFNSGENPLEVWLVSPGIDLSAVQENVFLNFGTKDGFYNGEALTVHISTDFSGNVETATWTELPATISEGSLEFPDNFIPSGTIDISNFAGNIVYIGFEYIGSDNGITTSYQIDNIEIYGN